MKTEYIATFYSHFGAIRFQRQLKAAGLNGSVRPVPRDLSSSCGTCVFFSAEDFAVEDAHGEIEQLVRVTAAGYLQVYRAENS